MLWYRKCAILDLFSITYQMEIYNPFITVVGFIVASRGKLKQVVQRLDIELDFIACNELSYCAIANNFARITLEIT